MQHRWLLVAFSLISCFRFSSVATAQTAPPPTAAPVAPAAPAAADDLDAPGEPAPPSPEPAPVEDVAPQVAPEPEPIITALDERDERDERNAADEMVVTGSRIRRSASLAQSAPVEIIDRKQLERTGATNAADIIQTLTSAQGSGYQGGGNPGNQGGGAYGTSSINLRGLGAAATLVLVNGRRLVPSGGGGGAESFADISVIPLAAIERIEVLKGGGSAIYGADAVGGVVNIITRSTFDGVRVELDGQGTTRTDQGEFTASGAFGAKTERSRVMVALSYNRRTELRSDKRPFSRAANVDPNGNPATYIIPGYDPNNLMRARFVDPACSKVPGSAVVQASAIGDEICTFNFAKFFSLMAGVERANVFANGSYDLTKHTSVFTELQVSRARSTSIALPAYSVPPPLPVVPANHIDNPFGRDVTFVGRPLGAANGPQRSAYGDDTFRVVAGLRGDFEEAAKGSPFENWEWDVTATWGVSRYLSLVTDTLREPFNKALNSCSDPSNLSGCFNPFYSAIDGTGTPNSQAVIDSFTGTFQNISEHALQTYNAGLTGSLFKLPGGDVGIAFGGEVRYERRQSQEDHDATQQRYGFILGSTDAEASRNIYSGYAEIRWPFLRGLELQTAVRVEHYTDIDRTSPSPFAGLTVAPSEIAGVDRTPSWLRRLRINGQVTSAFRAPSLYQAYPGFAVTPTPLYLPGTPIPAYVPVQTFGNPSLQPERALVITAGMTWQPIDEVSLLADFWNYDYKNRILLDPAQRALDNDIALMRDGGSDARVVRDPMSGAVERVQLTQQNVPGHIITNGIDFGGSVTLSGASFGGTRDDWGTVSVGAQGTWTLNYYFPRDQAASRTIPNTTMTMPPLHCDAKQCNAVGSRNYATIAPPLPRWRLNVPIAWGYRNHSASFIAHFISGIENDNEVHADGSLGSFKAMTTFDLQYGYTIRDWIGKELNVRIGLFNLFDALPPATRDNNGFDPLLYDPRGRMIYAKLVSTF